jgi:hypothetical protein
METTIGLKQRCLMSLTESMISKEVNIIGVSMAVTHVSGAENL